MDSSDGVIIDDVAGEEFITPSSDKDIFDPFYYAFELLQGNGWYIVLGVILLYYIYTKVKSFFTFKRSPSSSVREDDALERMRRIEVARLRQQAQLDAAAAKYLEEKRLKEEKASQEKIEDWERHKQGLGYKSKIAKKDSDNIDPASLGLSGNKPINSKPKLKSDYNPLMGDSGGSCSYKPSKRGGAKGG